VDCGFDADRFGLPVVPVLLFRHPRRWLAGIHLVSLVIPAVCGGDPSEKKSPEEQMDSRHLLRE